MATLTIEQKEANKLARKEAKELVNHLLKKDAESKQIEQEKNGKVVKEMTITIEWVKSRMWGNNPNASVRISFMDGTFINKGGYKCSGYGYDKESTVIAEIFNDFLKYELWNRIETIKANKGEKSVVPYGVSAWIENDVERGVDFGGGIGVSCYTRISEFIGGKFENISSGKAFDVYKFTKIME